MTRRWLVRLLTYWRSKHYYISTGCLHGDHDYCTEPVVTRDGKWERLGPSYSSDLGEPKQPATCKFCDVPCRCECHDGGKR